MAERIEPCVVVLSGNARDIAFYVAADGECQVEEFFRDPRHERAGIRLRRLMERLAATGTIEDPEQFRHEQGPIWGFKLPNQFRVACFQDGKIWVCTHAFQKNGKWRRVDFEKANAIRDDYLQRKLQQ